MLKMLAAAAMALALAAGSAQAADRRLVLVTVDGLAWTEVFRGADPERAADKALVEDVPGIAKAFVAPADRAGALMPFLHGVVARDGVLIGDRDHGSCMAVANDKWFSYPGYNEILTGRPDPKITSNAHGPNENVTILEWLNRRPDFRGKVRAVASWAPFHKIVNDGRSGVPVSAGWEDPLRRTAAEAAIAKLQDDMARRWPEVRFDAFTHAYALEALKHDRPKVLFVSYGETDDFAHDGRYGQMLAAARRTDGFLAELWKTLQADPAYRGKTSLIVTTDHGRGMGPHKESWRHHGKPLFAGSDATWFAAIGPGIAAGAKPVGDCASTSQVAATALNTLGLDWKSYDAGIGAPLAITK